MRAGDCELRSAGRRLSQRKEDSPSVEPAACRAVSGARNVSSGRSPLMTWLFASGIVTREGEDPLAGLRGAAIEPGPGGRRPERRVEWIKSISIPRVNDKLMHNKFMVLSRNGKTVSVWTDSTNISANALYSQLNFRHVIRDADVAGRYPAYWYQLSGPAHCAAHFCHSRQRALPSGRDPGGSWRLSA